MVRFSVVVALDDGAEVVVDDDFIQIIQLLPVARVDVIGVLAESFSNFGRRSSERRREVTGDDPFEGPPAHVVDPRDGLGGSPYICERGENRRPDDFVRDGVGRNQCKALHSSATGH